jgi:outer membrane protein OmpA-like peptidoglycan-associated protein
VAAETAALRRQLAEAKSRIAVLEQALDRERQRNDGARKAKAESMSVQPARPSVTEALGGQETERGLLLTLGDAVLSFPIGGASLPSGDLPALDRIASVLVQHPELMARIEGHTDSSGREEANLTLSQERAQAVKQALVERGASPERIEAVGLGETWPIADNGTRAGRDRNRRIEIYLVEGPR